MTVRKYANEIVATVLLLGGGIFCVSTEAHAERWRKTCQHAALDYDSSLVANKTINEKLGLCVFYVSPGPKLGGTGAATQAASAIQNAWAVNDPVKALAVMQGSGSKNLSEALTVGLNEEGFASAGGAKLAEWLTSDPDRLVKCTTEALRDEKYNASADGFELTCATNRADNYCR
jgi:hypothetical protein